MHGRRGSRIAKMGDEGMAINEDFIIILHVQPIYITFSIPESQLRDVKKYKAVGKLPVFVSPQDDESDKETGYLTFVDNSVDPTTGTIKLKGTFPNQDRKLWPGQFVRVGLHLTTHKAALVVPNQAVQSGPAGDFAYLV